MPKDTVPYGRLAIVQCFAPFDARISDPAYIEAAKRDAAPQLIAAAIKGGFVQCEVGPTDDPALPHRMQITLGIVLPTHVASLEQRIAERQDEVVREVLAEAEKQILATGTYYTGRKGMIQKGQAIDAMMAAATAVLERRSAMKRV